MNHTKHSITPRHAVDVDLELLLDADSHLIRKVLYSIPAGVIPPALVVLACQLAIVAMCSCSSVELSVGTAGVGPVEQLKKERDGRADGERRAPKKELSDVRTHRRQHLGCLIALPLWGQIPLEVLNVCDEASRGLPWHHVLESEHALESFGQAVLPTGETKSSLNA